MRIGNKPRADEALQACATKAVSPAAPATQCAKPTLTPPNGSGQAGPPIKVTIATATQGAHLRYTTVALREEARRAAETALALQPNLGEALLAIGNYYHACLKDYDTAVRYFEQARQFLPNSSQIPALLASVARRRGQWDRSESYFNQTERLDPRNVNLLGQHAQLYIELRRFPEALRKFDQVLDIMPGDVDTLAAKAAIAQAEGDLPRASALLALIHPPAEDPQVLETQVYQAILERRAPESKTRLQLLIQTGLPVLRKKWPIYKEQVITAS